MIQLSNSGVQQEKLTTKKITIKYIKEANIKGTTYYYLTDTENKKYRVSILVEENKLPFLTLNQKLEIGFSKEEEVTEILKVK